MKQAIRKMFRYCGLDLRRYNPAASHDAQFMAMLNGHNVDLIFDIGANIGQFGNQLRTIGYDGRIVSFEPLTVARAQLLAASNSDPLWEVAPQVAIGDEEGEIEIHIAGNSVSSSVLNMLESHSGAAPESAYVSREKVPLRRLDTIASQYLTLETSLFIKIDTQGYEDRVLQGGVKVLEQAIGLQLELSLVPLYDGQRLYEYMIGHLKSIGFELWGITPAFIDPKSGRLLQIDATFFRS